MFVTVTIVYNVWYVICAITSDNTLCLNHARDVQRFFDTT